MELTARLQSQAAPAERRFGARIDGPAVSAWTLAFALVTYLALRGGGYDEVVRSEAGVAVWWIVLLAALAGILPARIGRAGWAAIGLLGAFAAWTGLASGWSSDPELTVVELGRIGAYLAVLVLAIALQGRAAARHTINGLAAAIGFVTVLAVLSRLHPQAFPSDQHLRFLGAVAARKLSYPLEYWNALAGFAAMGVPLLLAVAVGARTVAGQALAAAVLPLSSLCIYLTVSRGGVIALAAGLVAFLLLMPRRIEATATLALGAVGSVILVAAVSRDAALTSGIPSHAAIHQGTKALWLAVIVCTGVALLQSSLALLERNFERPAWARADRRTTTRRALAAAVVLVIIAVAAGVPSSLQHAWHDFKQPLGVITPTSESNVFDRLGAANGNSRYQFWQAAVHANGTDPLKGIGPGTFQFYWAQHATTAGYVRNAHSLYFETLAETGIIGLALLGGLFVMFAVIAVRRSLRAGAEARLWIAAAAGGLAAFATAAAFEWVWQFATIASAALITGAVIIAGRDRAPAGAGAQTQAARPRVPRVLLAGLAVAGLVAVLIPLSAELALRQSRADASAGNLRGALQESLLAQRIEPYAAGPRLQQALVLEAAGDLNGAAAAAREAISHAPTDWQSWLTLTRIDTRRGATGAALRDLREARLLDPKSPLFNS